MPQKPIEEIIAADLLSRGWKLACAESLTGGLLGHRITGAVGSSGYFNGGIISYSNDAKQRLLGVSPQTLALHGAVSRQAALEMAAGARQALQADMAVSTTGIAGPGGAEPGKPVGTVWIAVCTPAAMDAWHFLFCGNRQDVKVQTAEKAMHLLHLACLQHGLEAVEVTARDSGQDRPAPTELSWRGARLKVESVGRRRRDGEAEHLLCRTVDGTTFTLLHNGLDGRWFLEKVLPGRPAA